MNNSTHTPSAPEQPAPDLRAAAGIAMLGSQVVVHGQDLHHDCLEMSFAQYYLFAATGHRFGTLEARVLEQLWISTGYPDARIWCNRIAGYLGSARVDPSLALAAATAAANSRAYGFRALGAAYDVLVAIPEPLALREAWLADQLSHGRILAGFGRPLHGHDERLVVALQILVDAGLTAGPALARADWLHQQLLERKGIAMNFAAIFAAICLDFGLTRAEFDVAILLMFVPGYLAVYTDQRARPPLAFLGGWQTRE